MAFQYVYNWDTDRLDIVSVEDLSGYLTLDQTTPQTTIGTFTFPILKTKPGATTASHTFTSRVIGTETYAIQEALTSSGSPNALTEGGAFLIGKTGVGGFNPRLFFSNENLDNSGEIFMDVSTGNTKLGTMQFYASNKVDSTLYPDFFFSGNLAGFVDFNSLALKRVRGMNIIAGYTPDAYVTFYGLKINDIGVGASDYAIYTGTGNVRFGGTTTPVGRLVVPMGEVAYFSTTGTNQVIALQSNGSTNMIKVNVATALSADPYDFDNGGSNNGRLRYTGETAKMFHIVITVSGSPQTANDIFVFGVAKNGTVIAASKVLGQVGITQAFSIHSYVTLATNEYIELYVGNMNAGRNFTAKSLNIFAMGM